MIAKEVDRWQSGGSPPEPAPDVLARFERRYLTSELAGVLEAVAALSAVAEAPAIEAAAAVPAAAGYAT